jgi:hypothetical protein
MRRKVIVLTLVLLLVPASTVAQSSDLPKTDQYGQYWDLECGLIAMDHTDAPPGQRKGYVTWSDGVINPILCQEYGN